MTTHELPRQLQRPTAQQLQQQQQMQQQHQHDSRARAPNSGPRPVPTSAQPVVTNNHGAQPHQSHHQHQHPHALVKPTQQQQQQRAELPQFQERPLRQQPHHGHNNGHHHPQQPHHSNNGGDQQQRRLSSQGATSSSAAQLAVPNPRPQRPSQQPPPPQQHQQHHTRPQQQQQQQHQQQPVQQKRWIAQPQQARPPHEPQQAVAPPPPVQQPPQQAVRARVSSSTTTSVCNSPRAGDMYFTRDAIDASLGTNPEAEARERQLMCAFIQNTGMRLALPQLAIATAVVFFHRFYASATAVRPNDKFVAATACLFLAGKVEEIPKYLEVVLPEAYATHYPTRKRLVVGTPEYKVLRLSVLATERAVLSAIAFDLTVQHPYTNLLAIIKQLAPLPSDAAAEGSDAAAVPASSTAAQSERKQLAQAAWNFVNDSLRTTLCLQYEPMLIAVAAVHMAAKVTRTAFAFTVDKAGVSRPWYEGFGARLDVLDAISKEMVSMYAGDECPPHISKLVKDETAVDGGATYSSVNTSKRASPTHTSASVSPKRRSPSTLAELPPPHLLNLVRDEDNDAIFANNGDERAGGATGGAADTSNATTSTSTSPPPVGDAQIDLLTGLGGGDDGKSPHVRPSNGKPSLSPPIDEIVAMVDHESPDDAVVGVPKLLPAMEAAVEDERSVMRRMPTGGAERRVPRAPSERFNPM